MGPAGLTLTTRTRRSSARRSTRWPATTCCSGRRSLPSGQGNTTVVRSAPHAELFPEVAVVVTHAGMGAVTRALAAGVPFVCVPMGRDQLDVAARVVHCGAGVRLRPSAKPDAIRASAERVSRYRAASTPESSARIVRSAVVGLGETAHSGASNVMSEFTNPAA
jgi:hypothetical protein